MTFYSHLQKIIEFTSSIRKLENFVSFDMSFPKTWGLTKNFPQETQVVPFETQDDKVKGVSFVCEFSEENVEKTLDVILRVIRLNKERELKEKLFKEVVAQLKTTFESNDLSTLEKLQIGFEENKIIETEDETGTESIGLAE